MAKNFKEKQYSVEDIANMRKNMAQGQIKMQEEIAKPSMPAPKYGNTIPSLGEIARKKVVEGRDAASMSIKEKQSKDLKSEDRRNLDREEEARLKKQVKEEKQIKKMRNAELNNISKNVGDNNISRYNSQFSLDKPLQTVKAEDLASAQRNKALNDKRDAERKAEADAHRASDRKRMESEISALQSRNRTYEEDERLNTLLSNAEKRGMVERDSDHYLVHRDRYDKLMQDNRLRKDIEALYYAQPTGVPNGSIVPNGYKDYKEFRAQLSKRYELTEAELDDMVKTFGSDVRNESSQKATNYAENLANKNGLLGTGLAATTSLPSGFEGAANVIAGLSNDDRNLRNFFGTLNRTSQETVANNIDNPIARGAYNIGVGGGTMAANVAMAGPFGILSQAGNTGYNAQQRALENGAELNTASKFGLAAGGADALFNAVGFNAIEDGLKEGIKESAKGNIRQFLINEAKQNGIAFGIEGAENVAQDIVESVADSLINNDNAELTSQYNSLVASGMSPEEAFSEVSKGYASQLGTSFLTGGIGGVGFRTIKGGVKNALDLANYAVTRKNSGVESRAKEFNEKNKAINEGINEQHLKEMNLQMFSDSNVNSNNVVDNVKAVDSGQKVEPDGFVPTHYQNGNGVDPLTERAKKNLANTDKNVLNDGSNFGSFVNDAVEDGFKKYKRFYYGTISKELANDIKTNLGIDTEGMDIIYDTSHMKHSFDRHGNDAKEALEGRIGVTPESYADSGRVFDNPDSIKWLEGKNSDGDRVFEIVKRVDGVYYIASGYKEGKNRIVVDSFRIKKNPPKTDYASNNAPQSLRPEPNNRSDSFDNNVTQDVENVNTSEGVTSNQLSMDLQFFANKKAEIENALQNENLSVEERADLEGQLDEVNRKISQFATNSAINSGVVSQDILDNDPFYQEAKMVTPTTEAATLDEAKGRIAEGNDTWVDAYNDGSKKIETATDVDTTMLGMRDLDNRIAEATDDATREQLQAKKNMLFAKAVQAVHNGGQFLQALKKWNRLSTDGVLLNAEKLAQDIVDDTYGSETGEKTSKNVKTRESSEIKEKSQKIINAIKKADGEDISKPVKKERSLEEVRQIVRNTFDGKLADRVKDFTDDDYNYVANLLKNGASTEDLSNAFKRRFATGKWGISDEARTQVNDLMNYAQSLDLNSRERVATEQKIFQILADEIYGKDSANFKEKFEAWRYLAMLGNPKTHVRNIIGNTLFQGVTGMSNTLAAKMEDIADKRSIRKTGHGIERTKAVLHLATDANDRALVKDSANDSDKTYGLWSGNKWNEDLRNNIESQKRIFKNGGVNAVNELNSNLLDAEDNMAMRSKYATSLAGYLKANGEDTSIFKVEDRIKTLENSKRSDPLKAKEYDAELENLYKRKEILDKGRERAIQSAKYSAFHEDNALADSLSKWSKDLKQKAEEGSKGAALMHYLIEGMLPFKKTPANILRSGVEYSPLNLVNDISKLRKYNKGYDNVELADVFDSMSKTLTGSVIMALGALMYDKGVLLSSTGDEKYQDQLEGKQNYSLRIGDYTATIDFAAPSVMPLLLGAEVMKSLKDDGLDFNDFVDAIESNDFSGAMEAAWEAGKNTLNAGTRIASPLVETSMLQGVNDTLEGISDAVKNGNAGDALSAVTGNLLTSYVTSGIPTLVGQVARATDNTRRSTTGGVKTLEKLQNKIPYLSTKNQPYIDAHGREQTNSPMNNILGRLAYQMFSPSYVAKVNETEGDKLAREVYNETKNPDVFSAWTGSKKIDGQKVSPEDYTKYMQTRGDADTRIRDMLAGDEWFRGLSKSDQEDILTGLKGLTDKIGEQEINPNFTSTSGELAAYNENPENLDSLLNYYKDKIHKGEVKNEMGTSSDFATSLYDSGDEKRINKYKSGTQIANEYGYDNLTEEEYLNYEKYGEAKLKKILNYKKTASELDVSNNEKFRKLLDSGISKESIKKASDAITSVENGKDEFGRQKYLSLNDTTYDIYKKDGTAGLRTYSKLTQANTDYDLYKQAKKIFKNLNEDSYIKMFKSLDGSAGSKADGDISQKELLRLFNTRNMTQQQVNAYWKAYGQITGKNAWKSIPELKYNKKTNTYEWKAVSKK